MPSYLPLIGEAIKEIDGSYYLYTSLLIDQSIRFPFLFDFSACILLFSAWGTWGSNTSTFGTKSSAKDTILQDPEQHGTGTSQKN